MWGSAVLQPKEKEKGKKASALVHGVRYVTVCTCVYLEGGEGKRAEGREFIKKKKNDTPIEPARFENTSKGNRESSSVPFFDMHKLSSTQLGIKSRLRYKSMKKEGSLRQLTQKKKVYIYT